MADNTIWNMVLGVLVVVMYEYTDLLVSEAAIILLVGIFVTVGGILDEVES